jgi:adenylyltransferase/sulfurtransferase
MEDRIQNLRRQVEATETELRNLKFQLHNAELEAQATKQIEEAYRGGFPAEWIGETLSALHQTDQAAVVPSILHESSVPSGLASQQPPSRWPLADDEYKRYGRQLIMPEVGLHGQLRLKNAKVLIVGVGGLGCPAAAYLAGAGVGSLGLMDGDSVEISNLHRQIAHGTMRVGMSKVDSACEYLQSYEATPVLNIIEVRSNCILRLNPMVCYIRHSFHLSPEIAISVFEQYDIVLDCTDHPKSRYLISDACVLAGKPLVSASALKTEGQLIVLNNPPRLPGDATGGPCYRCVFPKPPPVESVLSCGEGGILGPVVGVMGVLQALEAIKVLVSKPKAQSVDLFMENGNAGEADEVKPSMLMFSAFSNPQFRSIRLRSRRSDCAACSGQAWITKQSLSSGSLDYVAFCGMTTPVNILPQHLRISANDFARMPRDGSNMLIDVRDETQYSICALRGSINVPWTGNATSWLDKAAQNGILADELRQKYVVCRVGNDSQLAAKAMMEHASLPIEVKDIMGGFKSWRQEVDHEWPDY